jgi:hypothetical protein
VREPPGCAATAIVDASAARSRRCSSAVKCRFASLLRHRAITELLDRARAAGAVRGDVTLADLVLLLGSVPGPDVAPERRSRYVDIVLAGLRG